MVCGGYLRIDLLGKITIQEADDLYYIAIRRVKASGLPIGALDKPIVSSSIIRFAISCSSFVKDLLAEESQPQSSSDAQGQDTNKKRAKLSLPLATDKELAIVAAAKAFNESHDGEAFFNDLSNIFQQHLVPAVEIEKRRQEKRGQIKTLLASSSPSDHAKAASIVISAGDVCCCLPNRARDLFALIVLWLNVLKPICGHITGRGSENRRHLRVV